MNPFSQASNYVDLLNSQEDPQPFSYHPVNSFGSSQLPVLGTQQPGGSSLGGDTAAEPRERKAWTVQDDLLLISAWLNTSKDPIVCNEQKLGAFWKRISMYVTANAKAAGGIKREPNNCKNRWQKINEIVTKFSGSYAAATRERASGQNDNDVITRAYDIYFNNHATKFNLEYAWRQLRYDQKWCEISTSKTEATSKRRKVEDGSHSAAVDDEAQSRPPGVKAAKARAKKSVEEGKDAIELRTIKEIKDKDYAMRATLADKKILDSLIAKKEPLSKTDEALKEKLISMI